LVSTVTTSTITTITAIAALGWTTAIGLALVVILIILLIIKELASSSLSHSSQLTASFLNISIVPMVMVFAVIVAVKAAEAVG